LRFIFREVQENQDWNLFFSELVLGLNPEFVVVFGTFRFCANPNLPICQDIHILKVFLFR